MTFLSWRAPAEKKNKDVAMLRNTFAHHLTPSCIFTPWNSRFKIRTEVRTEVLKIRQESWSIYRQFFQDFAAIATNFSRFFTLNS